MLKFITEELREKFIKVIKYIDSEFKSVWELEDWAGLIEAGFDPNDYENQELSEDSEVTMSVYKYKDYITMSI